MGRGPHMTETKRLVAAAKPVEMHYRTASLSIKRKWTGVKDFLEYIEHPEGFPNVKAFNIFMDGVRWSGGDQHARNALLDRIEAKEARKVEQVITDKRQPAHVNKGATQSESDSYMSELEDDIVPPELSEEGPGTDDILN